MRNVLSFPVRIPSAIEVNLPTRQPAKGQAPHAFRRLFHGETSFYQLKPRA